MAFTEVTAEAQVLARGYAHSTEAPIATVFRALTVLFNESAVARAAAFAAALLQRC